MYNSLRPLLAALIFLPMLLRPVSAQTPAFIEEYDGFQMVNVSGGSGIPSSNVLVRLRRDPMGNYLHVAKEGVIYLTSPDGTLQEEPYIDIVPQVNSHGDGGLLDAIVHPRHFGATPETSEPGPYDVYLYYVVDPQADDSNDAECKFGRVSKFTTDPKTGHTTLDPASEMMLIGSDFSDGIVTLGQFHLTDTLTFGADGSLLVSAGESSTAGFNTGCFEGEFFSDDQGIPPDVSGAGRLRAQYLGSLGGSVLRIDDQTGLGLPTNPFYDGDPASKASRAWSIGLRNPFRIERINSTGHRDPAVGAPGLIVIGDVGRDTWEEVNVSRAGGENFGWPYYEHTLFSSFYAGLASSRPYLIPDTEVDSPPTVALNHSDEKLIFPAGLAEPATAASIVAGPGLGIGFPAEFRNRIMISDTIRRFLWEMVLDENDALVSFRRVATDIPGDFSPPVAMNEDPFTGDILMAGIQATYRMTYAPDNFPPVAAITTDRRGGPLPLTVQFDGTASFDPEETTLAYLWEFGDAGASTSTDPAPSFAYGEAGTYTASLTVTDGDGKTRTATTTIWAGNTPPEVGIITPTQDLYVEISEAENRAPLDLTLVGLCMDDEDGEAISCLWEAIVHFPTESLVMASSTEPIFDVTLTDEGPGAFFELRMTATDSGGASTSESRFVYPFTFEGPSSGLVLCEETSGQLTASASGRGGPFGYEWLRDGMPIVDGVNYSGADTSALSILSADGTAGEYSVRISSGYHSVVTEPVSVASGFPVQFASEPASLHATTGGSASFDVSIDPVAGAQYRWLRNGSPLFDSANVSGAATPSLSLTSVSVDDAGEYTCRISTPCTEAQSTAARLFVGPSSVTVR